MMTKGMFRGACALAALMAPYAAMAQGGGAPSPAQPADTESEGSGGGIQDIVVTAQRRAENIQKASVSIDVVSPDELARAGVTQASDLASVVPGLQIGQAGAATQIYIRGVGDFGATSITNPAVAFNVDGVYIARPAGIEGNFFDVERVEVLKGPQGTLYGRNATGGAINVITNKPRLGERSLTGAFEFANYDKISGEVAVNIPLGDTFAIRAAAQVVDRGPYVTMNFDDEVRQSARVQTLWEPTDNLSIRLAGDYTHIGGGGAAYVPLQRVPGLSPWTSVTDPAFQPFFNQKAVETGVCAPIFAIPNYMFRGGCPTVPLPVGPGGTPVPVPFVQLFTGAFGVTGRTDNEIYGVSGQLDWDFGFATLTLLPAYRKSSFDYVTVPGATTKFDISAGDVPETSKVTTFEARLANESDVLKWVIGGYYFNEAQLGYARVTSGFPQDTMVLQDIGTRSYAAFGQASFSVTDAFRLIGGARYTSDRRAITSSQYPLAGSAAFLALAGATGGACVGPVFPEALGNQFVGCQLSRGSDRKTFTKFNYKVGAEFDLTDQNMIYATYSTGFKAGGFYGGVAPGGVGLGSYEPENLKALEIGSRNRFFDNRLQLNFEGFYYKYSDHQEAVIVLDGVGNPVQSIQNAGTGRVYGASADLLFKPTSNGTLHVGVEYLDTKYTDFAITSPLVQGVAQFLPPGSTGCPVNNSFTPAAIAAGVTIPASPGAMLGVTPAGTPLPGLTPRQVLGSQTADCSGLPFTRSPKWSGTVGYSHVFDLAGGGEIEAAADMRFQSKRYLSTDYLAEALAGSYQTYNASLTYRAPENGFSVTAFIRNITNEAVYTSSIRSSFIVGVSSASISPPRTYGVRVGFDF